MVTPWLRRIGIAAVALLFLAAAGHSAVWWWAITTIEAEIAATLRTPPLPGWQASAGPMQRAGWPLAATVQVPALAATGPPAAGETWRWQAEHLSVSLTFARPRTLAIAITGRQSLQPGLAPPIPYTAARMTAEVTFTLGSPDRRLAIDVAELRAELPAGPLTLARLEIHTDQRPRAEPGAPTLTVTIAARGAGLPPGLSWALGPTIDRFLIDLVLSGPVPNTQDLADRATAWRDSGGTLVLRHLDLDWGEAKLSSDARLALDAQLQPAGTGAVRLVGHAAALRALVISGVLPQRTAVTAGAVLGLMARPPPAGGPPVLEVPLTLQNRTLALGRIPLVRVPELVWRPPQ